MFKMYFVVEITLYCFLLYVEHGRQLFTAYTISSANWAKNNSTA